MRRKNEEVSCKEDKKPVIAKADNGDVFGTDEMTKERALEIIAANGRYIEEINKSQFKQEPVDKKPFMTFKVEDEPECGSCIKWSSAAEPAVGENELFNIYDIYASEGIKEEKEQYQVKVEPEDDLDPCSGHHDNDQDGHPSSTAPTINPDEVVDPRLNPPQKKYKHNHEAATRNYVWRKDQTCWGASSIPATAPKTLYLIPIRYCNSLRFSLSNPCKSC